MSWINYVISLCFLALLFGQHTIIKDIKIPVQGGIDPQILLTNRKNIKMEAQRYLDIFKNHPYIFNLGHGVLPQTNPDMVEYLTNLVKNVKWKIIQK